MKEPIHDKHGNLTPAAILRIIEHFSSSGVTQRLCCKKPTWTPAFVFGEHTLTLRSTRKSAIANHGIPTINVVCASCGEIRSYVVSRIFPEWLEENKA